MNKKELIDYRTLYEQNVQMMNYNIAKEIAVMIASVGEVNFKNDNQFVFDGKTIKGICMQIDGIFVITNDSKFEFFDEDEVFSEFIKNPYNMIQLHESIAKELNLLKLLKD